MAITVQAGHPDQAPEGGLYVCTVHVCMYLLVYGVGKGQDSGKTCRSTRPQSACWGTEPLMGHLSHR